MVKTPCFQCRGSVSDPWIGIHMLHGEKKKKKKKTVGINLTRVKDLYTENYTERNPLFMDWKS